MTNSPLRVAVIGASGIGKNHARWFHRHGCEVCAFVGSAPEHIEPTQRVLQEGFGFTGRGYADVQTMLTVEQPQAVCIASPPALHYEQVLLSLTAGVHVLCEKPLVYDAAISPDQLVAQARHLVEEAEASGLLFGTQMQYAVGVDKLLELAGLATSEIRRFEMVMETKNLKHGREYDPIWIDLSPHPLSVLQKLAGGRDLDPQSIQCSVRAQETAAYFQLVAADSSTSAPIEAHITVRCNPDIPVPLRYFMFNEKRVDYAGRKDAQGEFRTYLTSGDEQTVELPDLVDTLIGNFVNACQGREPLVVRGADGAQNVDWQLQILQAARRG